jgi:hypothetical protein
MKKSVISWRHNFLIDAVGYSNDVSDNNNHQLSKCKWLEDITKNFEKSEKNSQLFLQKLIENEKKDKN